MKNKKLIIPFLMFLVVVMASIFAYKYLTLFFENMISADPTTQLKTELPDKFYFRLYIQCFLILFSSITLPFIFSTFAIKWKIDRHNWWKPILVLELIGLLLAYFTTPPDLISTILVFILWQLPVVINLITLRTVVRKNNRIDR